MSKIDFNHSSGGRSSFAYRTYSSDVSDLFNIYFSENAFKRERQFAWHESWELDFLKGLPISVGTRVWRLNQGRQIKRPILAPFRSSEDEFSTNPMRFSYILLVELRLLSGMAKRAEERPGVLLAAVP